MKIKINEKIIPSKKTRIHIGIRKYIDDNMPFTFDIKGEIIGNSIVKDGKTYEGQLIKFKDDVNIFIHKQEEKDVRNLTIFKNNDVYLECTDYFNTLEDKNTFVRKFGGTSIFIDGRKGEVLYFERELKCKALKNKKIDKRQNLNISTFDIECYLDDNNVFRPYACGFAKYIEEKRKTIVKTYYITDFASAEEMFKACFDEMLKSNLGTVYVHNLSKFDLLYINEVLAKYYKLEINIHRNKLLELLRVLQLSDKSDVGVLSKSDKFKPVKSSVRHSMVFRDSLLLLPDSLDNLGKTLKTNVRKSIFLINSLIRII